MLTHSDCLLRGQAEAARLELPAGKGPLAFLTLLEAFSVLTPGESLRAAVPPGKGAKPGPAGQSGHEVLHGAHEQRALGTELRATTGLGMGKPDLLLGWHFPPAFTAQCLPDAGAERAESRASLFLSVRASPILLRGYTESRVVTASLLCIQRIPLDPVHPCGSSGPLLCIQCIPVPSVHHRCASKCAHAPHAFVFVGA